MIKAKHTAAAPIVIGFARGSPSGHQDFAKEIIVISLKIEGGTVAKQFFLLR